MSFGVIYKNASLIFFSRWITLASNILRLFAQTPEPSDELVKMVKFILNVYAPVVFELKRKPHITQGSLHIFHLLQNGQTLLPANSDDLTVFQESLLNNNYFMNHELIIVALLADPEKSLRKMAFDLITEARSKPVVQGKIRFFEKPAKENVMFDASHYWEMLDFTTVDVTEPPVTFGFSEEKLMEIVNGKLDFKAHLGNVYCHTQSAERAVANTTLASSKVVGQRARHGFILAVNETRKRFGKTVTKRDFQQLKEELEANEKPDDDDSVSWT